MVKGIYLEFNDDLSEVIHIRNEVFCKELGIPKEEVFDDIDEIAVHVLVKENDVSVATGRIYIKDDLFYIDHVAVAANERNKYYGDFVVRMLIDKAFKCGTLKIYTEAPKNKIEFFHTFGFIVSDCKNNKSEHSKVEMILNKSDICKKCQH